LVPDVLPHIGRALPCEFFEIDALDLAPLLLGNLRRRDDVVLRITEVETCRLFFLAATEIGPIDSIWIQRS
jgi:hypothetical protein